MSIKLLTLFTCVGDLAMKIVSCTIFDRHCGRSEPLVAPHTRFNQNTHTLEGGQLNETHITTVCAWVVCTWLPKRTTIVARPERAAHPNRSIDWFGSVFKFITDFLMHTQDTQSFRLILIIVVPVSIFIHPLCVCVWEIDQRADRVSPLFAC